MVRIILINSVFNIFTLSIRGFSLPWRSDDRLNFLDVTLIINNIKIEFD